MERAINWNMLTAVFIEFSLKVYTITTISMNNFIKCGKLLESR